MHAQFPPYDNSTMRSAYAIRSLEVFRLSQLTGPFDIMLSHDWPHSIWEFGNKEQLLRFKPYFRDDIESGKLGSGPCWDLLTTLRPRNWYAAHMHCRFDAMVPHGDEEFTRFVALDKCLPNRKCLDFVNINESDDETAERVEPVLEYDLEWLTVLQLTNNLCNVNRNYTKLPLAPGPNELPVEGLQRFEFTPTKEEMDAVLKKLNGDLRIPENFVQSQPAYEPQRDGRNFRNLNVMQIPVELNPQTTEFCERLDIDDPLFLVAQFSKINLTTATNNFGSSDVKSATSVKTPVNIPRAPLASFLPQPKFTNDEEIDLDDLEAENDDNDNDDKEPKVNPVEVVDEPTTTTMRAREEDETSVKAETNETEVDANPPIKKFKRRNQEIYANEEDE